MKFVFCNSSPPPLDVFVSRVRMENRLLRCVEEAAKINKKRDGTGGWRPRASERKFGKGAAPYNNPAALRRRLERLVNGGGEAAGQGAAGHRGKVGVASHGGRI